MLIECMEYAVTPKLVDPTNIPQNPYGLQRYAGSSLFIDSTLILCSAGCYATLTLLMVRLSILPRIKSVSARNCNCIIPMSRQSRVPSAIIAGRGQFCGMQNCCSLGSRRSMYIYIMPTLRFSKSSTVVHRQHNHLDLYFTAKKR
jgi:hypothetical protein